MRKEAGVKVDEILVVEGCESDDKTVLGGKDAFLSHFCTNFNFNICFSGEKRASKKINRFLNDGDRVNKSIENFITSLDRRV